jgi:hypothetical protein
VLLGVHGGLHKPLDKVSFGLVNPLIKFCHNPQTIRGKDDIPQAERGQTIFNSIAISSYEAERSSYLMNHHHHQWLYSSCKDLSCLTPEVL